MQSVVILGPAYPFRGGGITTFNERLTREFMTAGYQATIYNFSLQYPSFLFPGKTQYSEDEAPEDLEILSKVNSVNPANWLRIGKELKKRAPDLIVVRYWLPFMGAALGSILRIAKTNHHSRVVAITDNIIPHEKRIGDSLLTKYFLGACDAFVTMSENVMNDLKQFEPKKEAVLALHPLYDNFGEAIPRKQARELLNLPQELPLLLFFGFIRKYKGLDLLIEAFKIVKETRQTPLKLLIAGEFYEEKQPYLDQIERLGLTDDIILHADYVAASEVRNYFCAADLVIQPYRNATQSGVTPLAYHFEKPMVVTNVGALASYVPDGKVGLVAEPDPASLAAAILRFFELGEAQFIPHLRSEKIKYSWVELVKTIMAVSGVNHDLQK
ncbi:MAG: glycosyltransferase [Chitinophagaceae bacterium]